MTSVPPDWCKRDTRGRVLVMPRGLSGPPVQVVNAPDPVWEYPILPASVGALVPPVETKRPHIMAESLVYRFHNAQPGIGMVYGLLEDPRNCHINPFNPLSGICDGRQPFVEMRDDPNLCLLCGMRITGYMKFARWERDQAFCYFCYLEHAKHMCCWNGTGRQIPADMMAIAARNHLDGAFAARPVPPQQDTSNTNAAPAAEFNPDSLFA